MKELITREEVESSLSSSEHFYILFFRHSKNDALSIEVLNTLEVIEKERSNPNFLIFIIDVDASADASIHLASLTKITPEIPQCLAYFNFRPMFMLSKNEITKEKLESLIPNSQ